LLASNVTFLEMHGHRWSACVAATTILFFVGCAHHVPYELSDADKRRFVAVARIPPAHSAGAPQIFGIDDCTLYKATTDHQDITGWRITLRSDWGGSYMKWMTVCTRESLHYDGKYVQVFFCAQAIGAGGGCADGGSYRSRDGEHNWETPVNSVSGWGPLPR
jgi:hypothetical protein